VVIFAAVQYLWTAANPTRAVIHTVSGKGMKERRENRKLGNPRQRGTDIRYRHPHSAFVLAATASEMRARPIHLARAASTSVRELEQLCSGKMTGFGPLGRYQRAKACVRKKSEVGCCQRLEQSKEDPDWSPEIALLDGPSRDRRIRSAPPRPYDTEGMSFEHRIAESMATVRGS